VQFTPEQELIITEALRDHAERQLRVRGKGDFHRNGKVKGVSAILALAIQPKREVAFDLKARPIWEIVEEIGASVPDEDWEKVPTDGARNLDHYLYGAPRK